MINGIAILYYSQGGRYEGEWKNDEKEGYAKEYLCNGNVYEGEIKNGFGDGYGICYNHNGDIFEGEFKKGNPIGYGIFYSSLGFKIEWYFKGTKLEIFLESIYTAFLFLNKLYSIVLRNKMTILFIIILIIGILIN